MSLEKRETLSDQLARQFRMPGAEGKTENGKHLQDRLTQLFRAEGWKKKGRTWYRQGHVITSYFNLQKSQWGGDYFYGNIGFSINELRDPAVPVSQWQCHVSGRIESILPSDVPDANFGYFGDGAYPYPYPTPEYILENSVQLVSKYLIPFFKEIDTPTELRDFLVTPRICRLGIPIAAREWALRLPSAD